MSNLFIKNKPKIKKFIFTCEGCHGVFKYSDGYYAYKDGFCTNCYHSMTDVSSDYIFSEPNNIIQEIEKPILK